MKLMKNTNFNFMRISKIMALMSIIFIIIGISSLIIKGGPKLSIDFTGGTIAQLQFDEEIEIVDLRLKLMQSGFQNTEIVEFGSPKEVLIKMQTSDSSNEISEKLNKILDESFTIRRIESVGPKIGKELQSDAILAIALALSMILLYIGFRFDFYYAIGSVLALIHDVLITLGIFSLLSYEIDLSIIAAFLTIVGYSLNDTIVVFDRIRENIPKYIKKTLEEVINVSLNQTLSRTVITSFTTLIVVMVLFYFGGEVIHLFAFALIVGVFIGTYSSMFIASPVIVMLDKKAKNKK
ncbi:MAG: protein translocase subunit SecF [Candidatus Neomarinimicrobiota bacterium]|nr:protein translocase subunit SecF [Candidatus Neomarinimicrobiota bacterium]